MSYSDDDIESVWRKGTTVPGYDPARFRKDACAAWMVRSDYGNRDSAYGWEIDHIDTRGPHILANWRPLQWENNASRQAGPLTCPITSSGDTNVRRARS